MTMKIPRLFPPFFTPSCKSLLSSKSQWEQTAFSAQLSSGYKLHTKQLWEQPDSLSRYSKRHPSFHSLYEKPSQGCWVRLFLNCCVVNKVVNQTIFKQCKTLHFFFSDWHVSNTLSKSFLLPPSLNKKKIQILLWQRRAHEKCLGAWWSWKWNQNQIYGKKS